ncbi:MAG TPA: Mu transposase C-terminal domain-containing protein [Pyrinomonadaceae bacterium]|nr:Mu transposase C-terminal domain-containing protein [Pyrinomonadaceae bacterium]
MPRHTLSRGMHFIAGRREYEILKRLPTGEIQIKDSVTNKHTAKPEGEIIEALFSNEIELLGGNRNQVYLKELLKKTGISDLTLLEENDPRRAEVERRCAYVLEVMRESLSKLTKETLKPIIDKIGSERGDIELAEYKKLTKAEKAKLKSKPSVSSLIRWVNRYIKSGEDTRALIPATKARGNRERKFAGPRGNNKGADGVDEMARKRRKVQAQRQAERVGEIVDEAIDEVFLSEQRFSVEDVYDRVVVKVADENEMRTTDDQLPIPHRSSIYYVVNKLDDYDVLEARYGVKIAEEKYKAFGRGIRPSMPLERVEADHTKLDMFVIDPIMMLPIGRPILTWLVCVYTKMVLGFYISFNPYGSLAILECLKHAIRPKTYVRKKYPRIRQTWNTYGVMSKLVLDNAPEFWGKHLEDACRQLGINIQYGQKGKAWYRPTIERSFRIINTGLIHSQPGTTFSDVFDRADYDPQKNALITPDKLDEITHKFLIDYLQFRPHRGIKDIPALRWEKGIQQWPPSLPAKAADLDIVLGYIEHRQLHHYGIEIDTILYNDEDLSVLRSQHKSDTKFAIKLNPNDLSLIYVYDDKHDRYLPVCATDQEYTKGLTLYQHKVIRRYVRERLKRKVDTVSLCRAKLEIQEIVERDWPRVKSSRVKMARFRNEGIQDRREGIEHKTDNDWMMQALGLSTTKERLLLINSEETEKSRKGISDLENAFNISGEVIKQETSEEDEAACKSVKMDRSSNRAGAKIINQSAKKNEHKKGPGGQNKNKKNRKGKADQKNKSDYIVDHSSDDDETLDMTGWKADYDLPK